MGGLRVTVVAVRGHIWRGRWETEERFRAERRGGARGCCGADDGRVFLRVGRLGLAMLDRVMKTSGYK